MGRLMKKWGKRKKPSQRAGKLIKRESGRAVKGEIGAPYAERGIAWGYAYARHSPLATRRGGFSGKMLRLAPHFPLAMGAFPEKCCGLLSSFS